MQNQQGIIYCHYPSLGSNFFPKYNSILILEAEKTTNRHGKDCESKVNTSRAVSLIMTSFWETHDNVHPAAGQRRDTVGRWEDTAGRLGGKATVPSLGHVFAEAVVAKITRNCWEGAGPGPVRTALSSRRALGSRVGSPSPPPPPAPGVPSVQPRPRQSRPSAPPHLRAQRPHRATAPPWGRPWLPGSSSHLSPGVPEGLSTQRQAGPTQTSCWVGRWW